MFLFQVIYFTELVRVTRILALKVNFDHVTSVSYTHLDVYKRQTLNTRYEYTVSGVYNNICQDLNQFIAKQL